MNMNEIPTPETNAAIKTVGLYRGDEMEIIDPEFACDLERRLTVAREALDKLARLGNEPNFGYSDGNIIAFNALART